MKMILKKYFIKSTFDIHPTTLKIKTKNSILRGYRVLHLSDLHINTKTTRQEIQALITQLNTLKCNIVVITGDIIDTKVRKIDSKLLLFKELKHTTYYISGNHDLVYGYKELNTLMQKCDITLLDNRYEILKYKDKEIVLAGLSDRFSKFFRIKRHEKELVNSIKDRNLPKLFIAHQPKDYKYALQSKSDLFLCGHTHGGQIYPFHYLVRLTQPFLHGLHIRQDLVIYVSRGIGAWGIKYRFLADKEITLLELE